MSAKFHVQLSSYGRFYLEAESREQAEQMAEAKRRWERSMNKLVWRDDLATEFDRLTEEVADAFACGRGVSQELMSSRKAARAAIAKAEDAE